MCAYSWPWRQWICHSEVRRGISEGWGSSGSWRFLGVPRNDNRGECVKRNESSARVRHPAPAQALARRANRFRASAEYRERGDELARLIHRHATGKFSSVCGGMALTIFVASSTAAKPSSPVICGGHLPVAASTKLSSSARRGST